jgi:hypothetical protein
MTNSPDPAKLSFNENPDKYRATIKVVGYVTVDIKAESLAAANKLAAAKAGEMEDSQDIDYLDEVEEVEVSYIYKRPDMYRVLRDGLPIQTSQLRVGDLPRDPDERGF